MKQKLILITTLVIFLAACRKDGREPDNKASGTNPATQITLEQIRKWYRPDSSFTVNWNQGTLVQQAKSAYWQFGISGRPTFRNLKLGYRRLIIYRDSTGVFRERILEIVPDALYLQKEQQVRPADFSGRIFIYDRTHHLLSGRVYAKGIQVGLIRPSANPESKLHTNTYTTVTTCVWTQQVYADTYYNVTVYDEKICTETTYDDGGGSGNSSDLPPGTGTGVTGGSGGTTGSQPGNPPAPANLPGESKPGIKASDYMKCFGNIPDKGAITKVTVYVQEPFPGTSFNIGPNSVGHVAIGLTKTNGSQSVTQVVGFYPDASGLNKLHAPSKLVDNSALDYTQSISYSVDATSFKQITAYIATPPAIYDLNNSNCTNFVYNACLTGGITLPDPYTIVGLNGAGGIAKDMTPAGLGTSLEELKGQPNVNTSGGNMPNSKGPCK